MYASMLPAICPSNAGRTVHVVATVTDGGVRRTVAVLPSPAPLHNVPLRKKTKRTPAGIGADCGGAAGGVMPPGVVACRAGCCHRLQPIKPPTPSVRRTAATVAICNICCHEATDDFRNRLAE